MIAAPPPPALLMTPAERRRWVLASWRYAVPAMTSMVMLLLMLAPLPLVVPIMPHLGLLAVLAWAMLQPGLMPPWVAFGVGAVADLLFGQPLGVNATLFAVAAGVMRLLERRIGRHGHGFDWAVATVVMLAVMACTGPLMALAGRPVPMLPMLWQAPATLTAWPLVVRLAAGIQLRLVASMPGWRHG